jgi:hypothetical protein
MTLNHQLLCDNLSKNYLNYHWRCLLSNKNISKKICNHPSKTEYNLCKDCILNITTKIINMVNELIKSIDQIKTIVIRNSSIPTDITTAFNFSNLHKLVLLSKELVENTDSFIINYIFIYNNCKINDPIILDQVKEVLHSDGQIIMLALNYSYNKLLQTDEIQCPELTELRKAGIKRYDKLKSNLKLLFTFDLYST